ncbi:cupin domain-containing protein [Glaciimonas sp. GG7]
MDRDEFVSMINKEGFAEGAIVEREINGALDTHVHPFEAKALILAGELHLLVDGAERAYLPGQIFHLQANVPHSERYGSEGVQYLVGRK